MNDTSPEAEQVLDDIYRQMSVADKWLRLGEIYRTAKILHATGVRARNPAATPEEIHRAWLKAMFGEATLKTIQEARGGASG